MDRLKEIEQEINKLTQEKYALKRESESKDIEWIASLEWTKEYHANLVKLNVCAYGIPEYEITLSGDSSSRCLPNVTQGIDCDGGYYTTKIQSQLFQIYDENKHVQPRLTFYNREAVINFLLKHEFKSLSYEIGYFEVLKIAEIKSKQCSEDRNYRG